jgi:hypothetical protein
VIVTVQTMVYDLGPNGGIGRLVGHVALNTACGDFHKRKSGKDYYVIDPAVVTLDVDPTPRPGDLVAVCSAA